MVLRAIGCHLGDQHGKYQSQPERAAAQNNILVISYHCCCVNRQALIEAAHQRPSAAIHMNLTQDHGSSRLLQPLGGNSH